MGFKKINNITGWVVFAVSLVVYFMTMERTVSFWDCGEFLSTAYKLEVGHSPGAPLFMMMGRIFAIFAPSVQQVALFVNAMSAVASAFTILFLFWSITHFAKRIFIGKDNMVDETITNQNIIAIMGAGIVGALAYTFSDTFWFSAVEAEVYATSSFFTALVFWAILKWEDAIHTPYADKWLVLIAYAIGLSTGVHLLSLLIIPTIALIYYFNRYTPTVKGGIIAFIIGGIILGFVQIGVIQYLPAFASKFELIFVNSFGLPYNTGAIFFFILLTAIIVFLLKWSKNKGKYALNTAVLAFTFTAIGYVSSYVPTILRAQSGVSINMTNPDNVVSLLPYLQRVQYGSQPLLSGQFYNSRLVDIKDGSDQYLQVEKDGKDTYEKVGSIPKYVWDETHMFPRLWSSDPNHARFYQSYLGLGQNEAPTGKDNIKFFMGYQVNWMFWRYFMWNYTGRQNDYQGYGDEPQNGNWISGINAIDKALGNGDFDKMPEAYKQNRARNTMYFLPFILGIIGLVYQFNKNKRDGFVVLSLFFMTGIAVQLYINNTPMQPRERDYQYIATYAYAIWIGIGVIGVRDMLSKVVKNTQTAAAISTVICLVAVPVLMASQEWDDHDRSLKTLALDQARNMLATCDSNAILVTNGDNETYPLWYIQEIEGYRTDVRILNYNLLGTDWQNIQMFNKVNDADAVPVIWKKEFVKVWGNKNAYPVLEDPRVANRSFEFSDVMAFLEDPRNAAQTVSGDKSPVLPTKNLHITVDKEAVLKSGLVKNADSTTVIPEVMQIQLNDRQVVRSDMSMLNIIAGVAKQGWKRPIYVTGGVSLSGLEQYAYKEGVLTKIVPVVQNPNGGLPMYTDLDKNINIFLKDYQFGLANTDKVYYDESNKRTFYNYMIGATELANNLSIRDRKQDAIKVLDDITSKISYTSLPLMITPYENVHFGIAEAYYIAGQPAKAQKILEGLTKYATDFSEYFLTVKESRQNTILAIMNRQMGMMSNFALLAQKNNDNDFAQKISKQLEAMNQKLAANSAPYSMMMQQMMQQQRQQMQQQAPAQGVEMQ